MENNTDFEKIITDFTHDLEGTFPEYSDQFKIINYSEYYEFCSKEYPERFFDILYENEDLFKEDCYLLPELNFSKIMKDDGLSEQSKKTIWKYLQLILFCVCNNTKDGNNFGDSNLLFQAVSEEDLHKKISTTMEEMRDFFEEFTPSMEDVGDISGIFENMKNMFEGEDMSGVDMDASGSSSGNSNSPFGDFLNPDRMNEHLSGLMDGKIGSLAKEIAEEATKEFADGDEGELNEKDMMSKLLKNPGKIMSLVKNIGGKLEDKIKSGEFNESELMEEAQELMGKIKDMPGLKKMMNSMGMGGLGGKMDFKGMASKMQQTMKQTKMKEHMRAKMERNAKERADREEREKNMANLRQEAADTFVWTDENSNPSTPLKKSTKSSKPVKKSGKNKKKGKGKKK